MLVVADSPARALQLRTILTFAGFDTCLCTTVADAMLALKTVALDAALIDLATDGTGLGGRERAFVARATGPEHLLIGLVLRENDEPLEPSSLQQYGIDFSVERPYGVNAFRQAIASPCSS